MGRHKPIVPVTFAAGNTLENRASFTLAARICFLATCALIVFGWLSWCCLKNPNIRFLPLYHADWIVYPQPLDPKVVPLVDLSATFRRSFILSSFSSPAVLRWLAFTNCICSINGHNFALTNKTGNWKNVSQIDITSFLRPGTNLISMTVSNRFAPPALCAWIETNNTKLVVTDQSWEASLVGACWAPARLATSVVRPAKGNPLHGAEEIGQVLPRTWHSIGFAAAILVISVLWPALRKHQAFQLRWASDKWPFLLCGLAWITLLLHNALHLPATSGFDAEHHVAYIKYIQSNHALPQAHEGWQMYQPPLYYLICAGLLKAFDMSASDESGIVVLRVFGVFVGLAHLALVLACLRLLFPGNTQKQWIGTLLAAFIPAHLYMCHFVTNETLTATLVTAALLCALKIFKDNRPEFTLFVVAGLCLGGAMLTKVSALMAAPFVFALAGYKLISTTPRNPTQCFFRLGSCFLAAVIVCGWFYWHTWTQFGKPLIGNWNPELGRPWWQLPGYHTAADFFRFGHVLIQPFFSGFQSFWDSLYSTLWGDGYWAGRVSISSRPPWNYDWMTINYWVALLPTIALLTGLCCGIADWVRANKTEWLVLSSFVFAALFSIAVMSLNIPSYAQAKAFYGLSALVCVSALGALGYDFWCRRGTLFRHVFQFGFVLWALGSFGSFWIDSDAPDTHFAKGVYYATAQNISKAEQQFSEVLKRSPDHFEAKVQLAALHCVNGDDQAGSSEIEQIVAKHPEYPFAVQQLCYRLLREKNVNKAIMVAQNTLEATPENPELADFLCGALLSAKRLDEGICAGRMALKLSPADELTHYNLGYGLLSNRQYRDAIFHLSYALKINPSLARAHYCMACALEGDGRPMEAVAELQAAIRLDPHPEYKAGLKELEAKLQSLHSVKNQ